MTAKITMCAAAIVAVGCLTAAWTAQAQNVPLGLFNVGAPAVYCRFNTSCKVVVEDTIGTFTLPGDSGNARLQSRTFGGTGDMAYVYRVDLTGVQGKNCVSQLTIITGQTVLMTAAPGSDLTFRVFVVTSGGLGSVGLSSAVQTGAQTFFTFSSPVCPGSSSYFFGFASKSLKPVAGTSVEFNNQGGSASVADRWPG